MKTEESPRKRKSKDCCRVRGCMKTDADRPMAFKGEKFCSENHRKILVKQGKI